MLVARNFAMIFMLAISSLATPPARAVEFKVDCASLEDCMDKGDRLTRQRKLSLALEAYRNAIKFDTGNQQAWRKFEMMVVRIYEEGGC